MTDPSTIARMDKDNRTNRPVDADHPGQAAPGGAGGREPDKKEETPRRREPARPETLPPSATSGGLPSEPGWMRQ